MRTEESLGLRSRAIVVAGFITFLCALCVREYVVNILPNLHFLRTSWLRVYDWKTYACIASILALVFSGTMLLLPEVAMKFRPKHSFSRTQMALLLGAVWAAICGMMLVCTNHEFGAFDQSIIVDTLWRQALGQTAYKDFVTTNPPLFVLGLRLAAFLFGKNWMAQCWLLCCFSGAAFYWTYWLLRRLLVSRAVAVILTISTQIAGLALLSFWWFNSITAVVSSIFLLSSLLLLQEEDALSSQLSFVASWVALGWVKPNAAGLFGLGVFLVLLIGSKKRIRMIALTATGLALSAGLLSLCVPVKAVLQSYYGVAQTRAFAFLAFKIDVFYTAEAFFQFVCLSFSLLILVPEFWRAALSRNWQQVSRNLLLILGAGAGFFVLASNGDIVDVGLPPILVSVGLAVFTAREKRPLLRLCFLSFALALLGTQTYKAFVRLRSNLIGMYAGAISTELVHNEFFSGMRTGPQMNLICDDIGSVLKNNPGSIFFTSRLEWAYAAFHLQSPPGLPVFWQAGTSYAPQDEAAYVARWKSRHYQTVMQSPNFPNGKEDWIAFPAVLQTYIHSHYKKDTAYRQIVVWRRRDGSKDNEAADELAPPNQSR